MEYQLTFADSGFSSKRRKTSKEIFLSRMDILLPRAHVISAYWTYLSKALVASSIRYKRCFVFIAYSIGTT